MRVWLNHWFSTAYYFVESLKKSGFYVMASNKRESCVYKTNADEFYIEPDSDDDYVEYCLSFCKEHDVEILVPRRGLSDIVRNKSSFEQLGIQVLCENDIDIVDVFDSKSKTARYFEYLNVISVPECMVVNNASEFIDAYSKLKENWSDICIKYDCDEGGQSFKRIKEFEPSMTRLTENYGLSYSLTHILECMKTVESFKPMVVMPYLNGVEVSVDCFGYGTNFIAVPRYKLSNRVTRFEYDKRLYNICRKLWLQTHLTVPFNVQFRYHDGELYILEVNLRLSGGSWKAQSIGVDFIGMGVKSIASVDFKFPEVRFKTKDLSNLEGIIELW